MRILIDADGCPVVDITIRLSKEAGAECHIFCDSAHEFDRDGATTHTVMKGADSADFYLVNFIKTGDVVITQDYGLASMALSRGARVINQDGLEYTEFNIDALLLARHTAKKIRNAGGRLRGNPPRKREQNESFEKKLREILLDKA
ncbi:MAG: DUF188 domain-containing protein [Oscillospiraceae bacterium]|nr:DUF188 domain-containing protein [Oscillospiraceae bacterium]